MTFISGQRIAMIGGAVPATIPPLSAKVVLYSEAPEGEPTRFAINETADASSPGILPSYAPLILTIQNLIGLSFYGSIGTAVGIHYFSI